MLESFANKLTIPTGANSGDAEDWQKVNLFFFNSLNSVRTLLPFPVSDCLDRRGQVLPAESCLAELREILWQSIKSDSLGGTPPGAAVRASLFAFYYPEEGEDISDAVWNFCHFYWQAGLPEQPLANAFYQQWPKVGP